MGLFASGAIVAAARLVVGGRGHRLTHLHDEVGLRVRGRRGSYTIHYGRIEFN